MTSSAELPEQREVRGATVLIVDDAVANRGLLTNYLERAGYRVLIAGSGETGLERAKYAHPDLVLLDVHLPGIDGYEVCRRLQADPDTRDIPVIFITAWQDSEDTLRGFQVGGVDYITTPFHYDELVARVTTHVRLRRLTRELQAATANLERRVLERTAELAQTEAQLRQAQKMEAVGLLAGGIAHDFNNLLTVILGYIELLRTEARPNTPADEAIEAIQTAAERAASLTQQLLAFSRQQVLQPQLLRVNAVVSQLADLLRRLIGEDITLITRLHAEPALVMADPGQLAQVIMNLAVNARDAMPNGGTLTIETDEVELQGNSPRLQMGCAPGRYVTVAVSDTGHGMDAETQARIFEPFFTTKPPGEGTGLGLATVHGIVYQSGGQILVDSTPERGTTLTIYLPSAHTAELPPTSDGGASSASPGGETILLVEDEPLVRQMARTVLQQHAYTVLEASTGPDALELARTHPGSIDLVLTDVILPGGLSGPQMVQQVLAQRPHVQVVYMSGYTESAMAHHGQLEPGLALLEKPFTPGVLADKVRAALASGQWSVVSDQ